MRKYNIVTITAIANPKVIKMFGHDIQTISFEPKKKPICVYTDGHEEEWTDSTVRFIVSYNRADSEIRPHVCGQHYIIMFDHGHICIDAKNDMCVFS